MAPRFFDAYVALGPLTVPMLGQELATVAALRAELDRSGIAAALVYSTVALDYDAGTGNELLSTALADEPDLHPCWVLLPPGTGEFPPPAELMATMAAQGVRAARLCPGPLRHNFSLEPWCSGELLEALAAARVPLFLDLDDTSWSEIAALLATYSELPLVVTGVTYRVDRYLYPLLARFPNLHIDLSGYQGLHAIEHLVARFGAERLLFGSHLPLFEPGATITHLCYAAIDDDAKALIAHGNLERLLEGAHGH